MRIVRTEEDVARVWKANETLLRVRVYPNVIQPLAEPPGLPTEAEWDYIVAASMARSYDTFRAIQLLCSQDVPGRLWIDAFILSRSIFEADTTLRWCAKSPNNLQRFLDENHLQVARTFNSWSDTMKAEVLPARQEQIKEREKNIIKKYGWSPKQKKGIMVSIWKMCEELSEGEKEPNALWEYKHYYQEVSSFAHTTAWQLFSYRARGTPVTQIATSPDTGFRALLVAGGSFIRILRLWNNIFKRLSPSLPIEWLEEWTATAVRGKSEEAE